MKYIFFLVFTILFLETIFTSSCGFNTHGKDVKKSSIDLLDENDKRFLQTASFQPIRITIDYTTFDKDQTTSTIYKTNIKQAIEKTIDLFRSLLSVKPLTKTLKYSECDNSYVTVGSSISTTGVQADLVIHPFIIAGDSGLIEAFASHCIIENTTGRPVAGLIGFSSGLNYQNTNWLEYFVSLAFHELTHVLVFNPDLFPSFITSTGAKLTQTTSRTTINGLSRTIVTTPKVVAAARKHFGCSSLEGVELENQGGEGTAGGHWEARVMLSDYMNGESYVDNVISEITLALFEDSGWYKVNYYTGGLFRFGKNQGCDFTNTKCIENNTTKFSNEFCLVSNAQICTSSRMSRGYCDLSTQNAINKSYQYWTDPSQGGYTNADYCPVAEGRNKSNYYFYGSCAIGGNINLAALGETIGYTSNCFMSSLTKKNDASLATYKGKNNSLCYAYTCDTTNKTIQVTVASTTITCPTAGGPMTDPSFDGQLQCPDYNLICTGTKVCNTLIDCVNKQSLPIDATYNYTPQNGQTVTPGNILPTEPNGGAGNSTGTVIILSSNYKIVNFFLILLISVLIFI